ncbi:MAG: ATP-binding protein [Ruminococcus sp.]|nr:ATP-binding protein [Candidatus Apopatosoma intestinale]
MGFSRDNMKKIAAEYRDKNLRAKQEAEKRAGELRLRFPEIETIDRELTQTGVRILRAAQGDPATYADRMAALKETNRELREARADFLRGHGISPDYGDVHYECDVCMDTGYVGGAMCRCMKRALVLAGYESSGIGKLIAKQRFDNFDLRYYTGADREMMARNFEAATDFAETFSTDGPVRNLLFMGKTGLGKTHLSSAIAKTVIDGGYDVVYETAQNVFADFEKERFGRVAPGEDSPTARYLACDLLILDDLGTEMATPFSVATLYQILNARLNAEKSMIISTNITKEELSSRYADRITSRIFGEFELFFFSGKDIRSQKLMKN